MMMLQGLSLFLWLCLVPVLMGRVFVSREQDYLKKYLFGIIVMFALFETLAVPFIFLELSLNKLTFAWCISCILFIAVGVVKRGIKPEDIQWKFHFQYRNIPLYISLTLILFQVKFVVTHMHIDDDDAWYVGTAVTSYFTNTLNRIDPYTGAVMSSFPKDYTLSPWPVFWGMMGKLTGIHPAILMHTIAPAVLIPMAYAVYYRIARMLFQDRKTDVHDFMLFLSVFNVFANFSVRSVSTFMLFRIWQGKAVLCSILIPFLVYVFMLAVKGCGKKYWIILFLSVLAGTMVSSMGVLLIPALLSALAAVMAAFRRDLKICLNTLICILPCFLQFAIYYFALMQ